MKKIDFTINENDLPEIKDWKVGSEYELSIKVKMTGFQKGSMYSQLEMPSEMGMVGENKNNKKEDKPAEAHFEITEVAVDNAEDAGDAKKQPFAQEYAGKRAKGAALKDGMMNS